MYRGDIDSGCTLAGSFTTVSSTGAPTAIAATAGSLCLIAYILKPGDATGFTCSTAGLTLAINCGGRLGWHTWAVNTGSDLTIYSCNHDVELVLQGGTVGGVCVSGYVVAAFSLKNRSGLKPTVPGRTLDVTATGGAGVDWGNVENPTTSVGLTGTTISSGQTITSVSGAVGSVTGAVTVGTNSDKSGYSLSAAGVDCVGFTTIPEPSNVPGWPMSLRTALGWLLALGTNCVVQSSSRQSVCDRANTLTIATAQITCTPTIVHRGNFV